MGLSKPPQQGAVSIRDTRKPARHRPARPSVHDVVVTIGRLPVRTTVIVTAFIVGIGGTALSLYHARAQPDDGAMAPRPMPPPPHGGSMIGHPGLEGPQAAR
jgi:hypothetical protein